MQIFLHSREDVEKLLNGKIEHIPAVFVEDGGDTSAFNNLVCLTASAEVAVMTAKSTSDYMLCAVFKDQFENVREDKVRHGSIPVSNEDVNSAVSDASEALKDRYSGYDSKVTFHELSVTDYLDLLIKTMVSLMDTVDGEKLQLGKLTMFSQTPGSRVWVSETDIPRSLAMDKLSHMPRLNIGVDELSFTTHAEY